MVHIAPPRSGFVWTPFWHKLRRDSREVSQRVTAGREGVAGEGTGRFLLLERKSYDGPGSTGLRW